MSASLPRSAPPRRSPASSMARSTSDSSGASITSPEPAANARCRTSCWESAISPCFSPGSDFDLLPKPLRQIPRFCSRTRGDLQ